VTAFKRSAGLMYLVKTMSRRPNMPATTLSDPSVRADVRVEAYDAPNDKPVGMGEDGRVSDLEGLSEENTLEQRFGYVYTVLQRGG
jgi:hypothetical protein